MSYGEQFSQLLTKALEREESDLRERIPKTGTSKQSVGSVSQYYESWLSVPLLKEAIGDPQCPEMVWEKRRVDLHFNENGKTVASFELKPFTPVPDILSKKVWLRRIVNDFKRQHKAQEINDAIERYVVLVPFGQGHSIKSFNDEVMIRVRREMPGITVEEIPAPRPIKLNRVNEPQMLVEVFRVGRAAQR